MPRRNVFDAVMELPDVRPLSARSIVASVLLGTHPPSLPARVLVATGQLFGIPEGTVRVALSRMVADGDLHVSDGVYRLAPRLRERQDRQDASRHPELVVWNGQWTVAVVTAPARSPAARTALRTAMSDLRMGELREGVWMRPDNLDHASGPSLRLVEEQCHRFAATSTDTTDDVLASRLWDLTHWAATANAHRTLVKQVESGLAAEDGRALAAGFVLSAAVLRLMVTDPLLPDELAPTAWPGTTLRDEFDAFYNEFGTHLQAWIKTHR